MKKKIKKERHEEVKLKCAFILNTKIAQNSRSKTKKKNK